MVRKANKPQNTEVELDLGTETPEVVEENPTPQEQPEAEVQDEKFGKNYFAEMKKNGFDATQKGAWQKMYGHFIDSLFKIKGKTVVDLGCAMGAITSAMADYGAKAIGVDISKYAAEKCPFKNITFVNSSAADMKDIPDNSVDFVHSMHMFNDIPEAECEKVFSEIKRICKNGAIVFIILSLTGSAPKKTQDETLQPKYFWDEFAAKMGMKDGSKAFYTKMMGYNEAGWGFMRKYQWPYLLYRVDKPE